MDLRGSASILGSGREEDYLKLALQIIGLTALLVGLLWVGQGAGVVRWPAASFMIDQRPWLVRGILLAAIGLVLMWFSRRR